MLEVEIGGTFLRVADPDWGDPLDASFAAQPPGQRWNPHGVECLYVNHDRATARANVARLFDGKPYGPEDLDPATAPLLIEVTVPEGAAADAHTAAGLAELGLPSSSPLDAEDEIVPHARCQPLGQEARDEGLDGIDARSAAPGGRRELAWFPGGRVLAREPALPFDEWWYS